MRLLYSLLFYLSLPGILIRLWWRGRYSPAYRQRIRERFALINQIKPHGIWIHAVSVGEVLAAVPLIKMLKQTLAKEQHFIITTATPTGAERVKAEFGDTIKHFYMPYDLPDVAKRFLKRIRPKLLLIMETELWPNLLHYCALQHVPVFVANGRLSEKSARGYRRFSRITRHMLKQVSLLAAQTELDAKRFMELGLAKNKVFVTGSIKFDLQIPIDLPERARKIRHSWGINRPVWIAASTHEGEEASIIRAQQIVAQQMPDVLLIWVPRHPERFNAVAEACAKYFSVVRRSENITCTASTQIYVGDSMGEMLLFYLMADMAFVGGSLVPSGGHNPIEPAAVGLPILTGPHVFNFAMISEQLQKAGAEILIHSADELAAQLMVFLNNPSLRIIKGKAGQKIIEQNRGATKRQAELVDQLLNLNGKLDV